MEIVSKCSPVEPVDEILENWDVLVWKGHDSLWFFEVTHCCGFEELGLRADEAFVDGEFLFLGAYEHAYEGVVGETLRR